MSEWTDQGERQYGNKKWKGAINPVTVKKLEEEDRRLNSKMDREGLVQELREYKIFSLQQFE